MRWGAAIAVHASVLGVLVVVAWAVVGGTAEHPGLPDVAPFDGDDFWGGWVRWDGQHYVDIARDGYSYRPGRQSNVAFFPTYPLAMRGLGGPVDNVALAGIAISIASGLGAIACFWRWCAARLDRFPAAVAVALLALYPYAWYLYGAVYGDALFLLLVLVGFLLLERDQPLLAGLVGAAATASRLVGLALAVALVVGVLERAGALEGSRRFGLPRRVVLGRLRRRDLGVLVAPLGLLAWSGWLWHRFGDPLLFWSVQEHWGQESGIRTWLKIDLLERFAEGDQFLYATGNLVQGVLVVAVAAMVPAVARRFGRRYGAYQAVVVAVPAIGSQDFQGCGRYLLAAFPAFALVGERLARHPTATRWWLGASGTGLVSGTALFAHGFYLS